MNYPNSADAGFQHEKAAYALGRLDGALRYCPPSAERIFAGQVLRLTLISALRREGHEFTDTRFAAWFAGLTTLADTPHRRARPPRATCEAILTELAHSIWPTLSDLANSIKPALLAPRDHAGDDAHLQALAVIADGRALVAECMSESPPSALASLDTLHRLIACSTTFAPIERAPDARFSSSRAPSPLWAIDVLFPECLRAKGALLFAVPMPDLVREDAFYPSSSGRTEPQTSAFTKTVEGLFGRLTEAVAMANRCANTLTGRSTSRAPSLFELLAGFGPMRSAQIETIVGVSRLGARGIVETLEDAGLIGRRKVSGAILFDAHPNPVRHSADSQQIPGLEISPDALSEYEASMAEIDRLLGKRDDT